MRITGMLVSSFALLTLACASGGSNWVRADGSPTNASQLKRDRMDCFPTDPTLGVGSASVKDAEDCMRNRGWKMN